MSFILLIIFFLQTMPFNISDTKSNPHKGFSRMEFLQFMFSRV